MNRAYGVPNGFGQTHLVRTTSWVDPTWAERSLLPGVVPPGSPGYRTSLAVARAQYGPGAQYGPSGAEGATARGATGRGTYLVGGQAAATPWVQPARLAQAGEANGQQALSQAEAAGERRAKAWTTIGIGTVLAMLLLGV